jgi:hypothetical protein
MEYFMWLRRRVAVHDKIKSKSGGIKMAEETKDYSAMGRATSTPPSEQARLDQLKLELEAARKAAAEAQAAAQQGAATNKAEAFAAYTTAQSKVAELEAKNKALETSLNPPQPAQAAPLKPMVAPAPKFIAEHTLEGDETLSHLATKYYGHAAKPYWMLIYEANKGTIGDDPNRVRRGMKINIPVLPPDFKG